LRPASRLILLLPPIRPSSRREEVAIRPRTLLTHSALLTLTIGAGATLASSLSAQLPEARISVERRALMTYPFTEPDPVPILASDARLYPYHRFEGYAHDAEPREWTVVHLENEWIELWVLPEVGGKVWGARVKASGHEFVYRNEVLKFRNIALRGPWTSGGIEFNFGVIGHTPATATPVDYRTRANPDGSVSVFVGATDLPSRTRWRVEVRLPADRAYFETKAYWHNPTPVEQPYYNWMTGAAFARDDLVLSVPGNAYLEHPGGRQDWPLDPRGRRLSAYAENRFGGNKSYHVVGAYDDFFGGYYGDDDYGFGHWARYEEMPGQKIWLWALSRQGGIWEDLLTDTDGQYIEFQAGRLLVQYSPTGAVNPISQVGFDPGATDRWTETWFPVEGLGGLTDASREGAVYVQHDDGELRVAIHAFSTIEEVVEVTVDGRPLEPVAIHLDPLEPQVRTFPAPAGAEVALHLPGLGLSWESDRDARGLSRPFTTDEGALPGIPEAQRRVLEAAELARGRRLAEARALYEDVLSEERWNRDALLGLAELELRRGRYEEGLVQADRALQLDTYDARANFVAGSLYRGLGWTVDAREAFGWAARSMAFRSVSHVQLAELALRDGGYREADRHAHAALDYDRYSVSALRVAAVAARLSGDPERSRAALTEIELIDPLDHFVAAERWLAGPSAASLRALEQGLLGEYPEQEVLELAVTYARWGAVGEAVRLLEASPRWSSHAIVRAWLAHLTGEAKYLSEPAEAAFVFPYRVESLPVLREAALRGGGHWSWSYLLSLNLWARGRVEEAATTMIELAEVPDFAPFYVARTAVVASAPPGLAARVDAEADLRRAIDLDPARRTLRIPLIRYLQQAGRFEDALEVSARARSDFPGSFDNDLLHVAALVETMRFEPALEILRSVRVLPSEHSRTAHDLFAHAHLMAGLEALASGDAGEAARHFDEATTWPENLGQGRPYEPEERLERHLLGLAQARAGRSDEARVAFHAVVAATGDSVLAGGDVAREDLLAAVALEALDRRAELLHFGDGQEGAMGRLALAVREAVAAGVPIPEALRVAAEGSPSVFADVRGRLLYRALTLERLPPGSLGVSLAPSWEAAAPPSRRGTRRPP
jgi:tetratricopeptide (TPR) repeat protein